MRKGILFCLCFILVMSCTKHKQETEEQLLEYVSDPDHGLIQVDSIHGLKIEVRNKPYALIAAQELRGEAVINDSIQKSVEKKFSNNLYFNLTLSVNDKDPLLYSGGLSNFSNMFQTLAFQMDKFVFLTTSEQDTIGVDDFIYPRLYGMGTGSTILFAFSKEEMNKKGHHPEWIDFHLQEFGMNTGNKKFRFDMDDIEEVPELLVVPNQQ